MWVIATYGTCMYQDSENDSNDKNEISVSGLLITLFFIICLFFGFKNIPPIVENGYITTTLWENPKIISVTPSYYDGVLVWKFDTIHTILLFGILVCVLGLVSIIANKIIYKKF